MAAEKILVLANETIAGRALYQEIVDQAAPGAEVSVVAPALSPRIKFMVSDLDPGIEKAQARLDQTLGALTEAGLKARGEVGDADPHRAFRDAISIFEPDLIVISTHPKGKSNWLEKGVVDKAREEANCEVRHVIVDLDREATGQESAKAF